MFYGFVILRFPFTSSPRPPDIRRCNEAKEEQQRVRPVRISRPRILAGIAIGIAREALLLLLLLLRRFRRPAMKLTASRRFNARFIGNEVATRTERKRALCCKRTASSKSLSSPDIVRGLYLLTLLSSRCNYVITSAQSLVSSVLR